MKEDELKTRVLSVLKEIVPEADVHQLRPEQNIRDQIEFDSVDFLSFATGLEKALDRRIPECDLPKLSSLNGCLSYLSGA